MMLALCHLLGLPARYVSGHLLGQGGTHAWVEVIVARADEAMAVAFDPCNGRRAGAGYVTVATGRDYGDVAPAFRLLHRHVGRAADRQPPGGRAGRRLTPPFSAGGEQALERAGVPHGVGVTVVVEVGEDVLPGRVSILLRGRPTT